MIRSMIRSRAHGLVSCLASAAAVAVVLGACSGGTTSATAVSSVTSITATNTPVPPPTATATAVAVAQASVVSESSNPVPVTGQYGSVTASCPSGVPLLSGGFIAHYDVNPTGPGPAPTESYPLSNSTWKVTIRAFGATAHVTAIAVCLRASYPATIQIVKSSAVGNVASVQCPAGTALTGGGFQSATAPDVYSQPDGNGWKVEEAFINQNNGNPTVYALCASQGLKAASVQQANKTVGANQSSSNGAKCPQGQLPVGGGYNGYSPSVDTSWTVWHSGPNVIGQGSIISSGWNVDVNNGEMVSENFIVYLICDTH